MRSPTFATLLIALSCNGSSTEIDRVACPESSEWLGGLSHPWDLAFLPDGSALLTERAGRVSHIVDRDRRDVTGLDDVLAAGEGGLLGMTIDPEFAQNRLVYLCFSHRAEPPDNRVVRFRLSDAATALEERKDLVVGMPYSTGRHSGCRVRFFDGLLYVGTGDAARYRNPQDLASLGGKTLRLTRDGEPAPGNPVRDGKDPRIFTFGHRNVQGLARRPGTDRIYTAEHGPSEDDEVNLLVAGTNYGWSPGSAGGYDEDVPMTDREAFPEAATAVWSSGAETTALSGIDFLPSGWGAWSGALVGAELKNARLRVLELDEAGTTVTAEHELCAERDVRLRTPVVGPDGALYVLTDGATPDAIWRLPPP